MRQVDSVRAIAVGMVIVSHWTYHQTPWCNGSIGVQLFFVISGFLITGILLDARRRAGQLDIHRTAVLKSFYARRFLRIFPLFYATLAITFVLDFPGVRASIWWHLSYFSNVLIAVRGKWLGDVSHFWSLAVEEQFYLVWAPLMLFVRRRFLLPLIASIICLAPAFRLAAYFLRINGTAVYVMPFASTDSLGLGAMLAFLQRQGAGEGGSKGLTFLGAASIAGCLTFCTFLVVGRFCYLGTTPSWIMTAMVPLTALGVVWLAARGIRGPFGRLMDMAPLVYLGRISYGIYIFHGFVPTGVSRIFGVLGLHHMDIYDSKAFLALNLAVLIGISSLSWHFFEKKVIGLKRFFPYAPPSQADRNANSRTPPVRMRNGALTPARR
jgi:peptidoglycan/LPS O-acetylase OafA/YrhL